jgi:hypothetical protein
MIALLLAAGPGRGDAPGTLGGILIIVGVIVAAALVIALVVYTIGRVSGREHREGTLNSETDQHGRAGRT